jgi:hypothetical protein
LEEQEMGTFQWNLRAILSATRLTVGQANKARKARWMTNVAIESMMCQGDGFWEERAPYLLGSDCLSTIDFNIASNVRVVLVKEENS